MAVQSDFMLAINQIAAERGINVDEVLEAVKSAVLTGFRKDWPVQEEEEEEEGTNLKVEIHSEFGTFTVVADKKVVDEVTNPSTQISLADAKRIEPKLKVGDHIEVDVTPKGDFGRVAAQVAKQVILQKLRESEKEAVMEEFKDKMGTIETGVIQRMDGDSVIVEVRRASAVMEAPDRIPGEFYRSGDRMKFLIKKIKKTPKGKSLTVSRADGDFLKALFELEVPELLSGSVEIKAIAREAGSRSKVAVASNVEGVDPIGAFVGQKGVRINAVMNELKVGNNEEKIDIILWDENVNDFIANAFSPAQVVKVNITDEKTREVRVTVPDDQLSLAIGREGQNVRLAAKLTGWKIDIQGETIKVESSEEKAASRKVAQEARDAEAEEKEMKEEKEAEVKEEKPKKKTAKKAKAEVKKDTKKKTPAKKKATKKKAE